jgi:hypothetical protein
MREPSQANRQTAEPQRPPKTRSQVKELEVGDGDEPRKVRIAY